MNLMVTQLYAQAAATQGQAPSFIAQLFAMLPMFAMIFMIFYFLVHLPQKKEQKLHQNMLDNLKRGDQVITNSGMYGKVAGIETDKSLLLEISNGVKVKFDHSAIKLKVNALKSSNE